MDSRGPDARDPDAHGPEARDPDAHRPDGDRLQELLATVRRDAAAPQRSRHRGSTDPPPLPGRRPPRWAVGAAAALALLAVGAAASLLWGVGAAAGAPGVPVPVRPAATGGPGGDDGAGAPPGPALPEAASGAAPASPGPPVPPGRAAATAPVVAPGGASAAPDGSQAAPATLVVHVVGQVRRPGLARLPAGARVADALEQVGGAGPDADLARVNLARALVDGEQVLVPRPGQELPAPAAPPGGTGTTATGPTATGPTATGATGSGAAGAAGPAAPLDLNSATVAELDALPGLGPVLSGRVLEHRERVGRFSSVDELAEVPGIGDVLLERLRPLVTV